MHCDLKQMQDEEGGRRHPRGGQQGDPGPNESPPGSRLRGSAGTGTAAQSENADQLTAHQQTAAPLPAPSSSSACARRSTASARSSAHQKIDPTPGCLHKLGIQAVIAGDHGRGDPRGTSALCPFLIQLPSARLITALRSSPRPGRVSISSMHAWVNFRLACLSKCA